MAKSDTAGAQQAGDARGGAQKGGDRQGGDQKGGGDRRATWQKSLVRDYFEAICIAVIFALFVRTFVVQAFKIPSSSMEKNLLVGDHILVNKYAYGPRPAWLEKLLPYRAIEHGDVIVFKYPEDARRDFIKRVVGIGGDSIEIRRGQVVRNGEPLDETGYVHIQPRAGGDPELAMAGDNHTAQVPAGNYFMMGDNRLNSEDSRYWGTVRDSYIKGKALLIYWSFDVPDQHRKTESRGDATIWAKLKSLGYTFVHFFTETRWSRTFRVIH